MLIPWKVGNLWGGYDGMFDSGTIFWNMIYYSYKIHLQIFRTLHQSVGKLISIEIWSIIATKCIYKFLEPCVNPLESWKFMGRIWQDVWFWYDFLWIFLISSEIWSIIATKYPYKFSKSYINLFESWKVMGRIWQDAWFWYNFLKYDLL